MSDARLALRLVRGAGRRDVVLLLAAALGIALATFSLLVAALPVVVVPAQQATVRARVQAASTTTRIPPGSVRATLRTSRQQIDHHPYTYVAVAHAAPNAPRPPGLTTWPAVGHTAVSPALAQRLADDPGLAARMALGTVDPTPITPAGLATPDELMSYTTVDATPRPGVAAYGQSGTGALQTPAEVLLGELLALVVVPAAVMLALCLWATASSRRRRYQRLVVMGLSPTRCARLYADEITVVATCALAVGAVAAASLQGPIGESGVLGVTWWGRDAALGAGTVILGLVLGAVVLAAVRVTARLAMVVVLRGVGPRAVRLPRPLRSLLRGLRWAGAIGCLAAVGYLVRTAWTSRVGQVTNVHSDSYVRTSLVVGLVLLTAPAAADVLTRAALRPRQQLPLVARHALRVVDDRWAVLRPLVTTVAVALVVGAVANASITWTHLVAYDNDDVTTISVQPGASEDADIAALARITGRQLALTTTGGAPGGEVTVTAVRCTSLPGSPCPPLGRSRDLDGTLTVGDPARPAARLPLDPLPVVTLPPRTVVLALDSAPWMATVRPDVTLTAPRNGPEYDAAVSAVRHAAPLAITQFGADTTTELLAREQAMVLRISLTTAAVHLLLAFLLVLSQLRERTAPSTNALAAVGVPRRFLHATFATTVGLPLLVSGLVGTVIGLAACWGLLSLFGREQVRAGALTWTLLPALAATLVGATWGWTVGAPFFDREMLRE